MKEKTERFHTIRNSHKVSMTATKFLQASEVS